MKKAISLKSPALLAAAIGAVLLSASVKAAEVSGTVGFTNDYRFRGISQTAGDAAIQGSLDVAYDNGVYAGIWGSNLDFGSGDDANLEVDYYVGYGADINDSLSYDLSFNYYSYPGYDAGDIDYAELIGALYYGDLSFSFGYTNDYGNSGESAQYLALDYSYAINDMINLDMHAGHSFGDYWGSTDIDDYEDYSIGLSGSAAGLDLSVSYLINSVDSSDEVNNGAFRNDDTLLLSVSRTF
ncbi:TorF family putative porin [Marinobacterium jannaschii]|uniref:TorF family putative porin n=1 Tax=Marinobacterium jannaschii TaxID=64970 RepID=UPI0006884C8E|nr:TorF family putative porin [Marinobacterium jannaschii]